MYYIDNCSYTTNRITFSPHSSIIQNSVKSNEKMQLKFGVKTTEVEVNISDSEKNNQISLSNNIIQELRIPLTCNYDIFIDKGKIVIGPAIGILTEATNKKVAQMLSTYKSFIQGYEHIGGAIIVFSLEGIDRDDQTVSGFLYCPDRDTWEFNTFFYPGTVMSILEASLTKGWVEFQETMNHFISVLGKSNVFNYPHFSKWEMYHLLSPTLAHVLPETVIYHNFNDISEMLRKHTSIFIKPMNGRLGRQIFKIVKTGSKVGIQYNQKKRKMVKYFTKEDEMVSFFKKKLVPRLFLIQESIPLKIHDNRCIDFRIMMVKNEIGKWENIGIFSRFGAKGKIVSNITAGGYTEMFDLTLKKVWNLTEDEISKVKVEMEDVVRKSLNMIEENGYHCGNIGFDIGLDDNCNISIIEINQQNPDPYIALKAKNRYRFYLARFKNLAYAKYLQGFKTTL